MKPNRSQRPGTGLFVVESPNTGTENKPRPGFGQEKGGICPFLSLDVKGKVLGEG